MSVQNEFSFQVVVEMPAMITKVGTIDRTYLG